MAGGIVVHRFGPFELDLATGRLYKGPAGVPLSDSQSAILVKLVSNAGQIVPGEALAEAAWGKATVAESSLRQAVKRVRQALADGRNGAIYIETFRNRGCRFAAPVQRAERDALDASLHAQLAPYHAFVYGQSELDTLDRHAIQRAVRAFEEVVRDAPGYAPAHYGFAMACALAYEATTPDEHPDTAALALGTRHARIGCELEPGSGEAWISLAFVDYLTGRTTEAAAAARKARYLEPDNWRHALRAGYVTWGEQRLDAGRRVLVLCPGLTFGHWLRTTVFIGRGALEPALDEARLGCAAQDAQKKGSGFPGVGMHLLHGQILAEQGQPEVALAEFTRELAWADCGQLYARECAANTWYARGAVLRRLGRRDEANEAFRRALAIAPRHASANAALHGKVPPQAQPMAAANGQAIVLARGGRHADAARVYRDALSQAPPGCDGWLLPVEPMLNPSAHPGIWAEALALLRLRAT